MVLHACLDQADQAVLAMRRKRSHVAVLRVEWGGGKEQKTGSRIRRKQAQNLTNCIRGLGPCLGLYPTLTAGKTWLIFWANPLVSSMGSAQAYSFLQLCELTVSSPESLQSRCWSQSQRAATWLLERRASALEQQPTLVTLANTPSSLPSPTQRAAGWPVHIAAMKSKDSLFVFRWINKWNRDRNMSL